MNKPARILLVSLIMLSLLSGAFLYYLYNEFVHSPSSSQDLTLIYEVRPGQSFMEIARDLETKGIVKNAQFFNIFARVTGGRSKIKAGEYEFNSTMLPFTVLGILTSGKSIFKKFTFQEGLSIYEIAQLYQRQGFGTESTFMNLVKDKNLISSLLGAESAAEKINTLEGYLFPETYQITKFTTTKDLVINMVQTFLREYKELTLEASPPEGWTRHKIVTLASIVEKETGAAFERATIASVFFNRMKKGMKLQTDPTIIYGNAILSGKIENKISREDLSKPTQYNTYVISGLPPGPISNPGKESIRAVLRPEKTNFLFFVSRNNGTQVFSETYDAHVKAVQQFQLNPKARQGKSWRDLNSAVKSSVPKPTNPVTRP